MSVGSPDRVVDSSAVIALLVNRGSALQWLEGQLQSATLHAPELILPETIHVLRRLERRSEISGAEAAAAHDEFLDLPLQLYPMMPCAARVWDLREAISSYDAWYVALAEALGAPLVTFDLKLARASGPRCRFLTPDRVQEAG